MIIETNGRRRAQKWWLLSGIEKSDVLAAYQFKGAVSESNAYYNLVNSSTYLLSKNNASVSWVSDKGVFIPAVRGAGLTGFNQGYTSCAIRFSDVDVDANTEIGLTSPIDGYYLMAKTANETNIYNKKPGFSISTVPSTHPLITSNASMANGVLGYTRSLGKLYQNGQLKTTTTWATWIFTEDPYTVSVGNATRQNYWESRTMGTVYIQAAVFYNIALSDAQHAELAEKMNAI
jgi:hypothetical protein